MSRRSRRRQRDTNDVSTDPVLLDPAPLHGLLDDAPLNDHLVDRRLYAPEDLLPPERFFNPEPFNVFDAQPTPAVPTKPAPALNPRQQKRAELSVCVRREQRRQVLHALRKTGKGGSRKHRRRTQWSNYKC